MIITGHLDTRHLEGENRQLVAPLQVNWQGKEFEVPTDFVTDLASVPRGFRWLIPKGRNESRGAVVHDFIYRGNCRIKFTRAEADQLFLDAMEENGVGWVRRKAIYGAVRAGGMFSWRG